VFGTPDLFLSEAGRQTYMRQKCGLTAELIAERMLLRFRQRGLQ
jgi:hypothetical protein